MEALRDRLVVGSSLQIAETMHSEFFGICSLLIVVSLVENRFSKKLIKIRERGIYTIIPGLVRFLNQVSPTLGQSESEATPKSAVC